MAGHMRAAIELARQAHAQSGRRAVAAIIVHPHSQPGEEVVQVRADTHQTLTRRPAHPAPTRQHANTPSRQHTNAPRRPARMPLLRRGLRPPQVLAACSDCTTGGGEGGGEGAPPPHPLHHALMRCIDEVARRRRLEQRPPPSVGSATAAVAGSKRAAPGSGGDDASDGKGGGEVGGGVDAQAEAEAEAKAKAKAQAETKAYLCSGCDAYVTLEPCAMCAMALAHARIRRLVYAVPCASEGALGSRYRVHTERSINHHYQVFRGLLCDEARAALAVDESRAA